MRHVTRGLPGVLAAILSLALVLPVAATEPPSTAGALACDLKVSTIDPNGVESIASDTPGPLQHFQQFRVWGTGFPANSTFTLRFEDFVHTLSLRTHDVSTDDAGAFVERFIAYQSQSGPLQPHEWELSVSGTPPGCSDIVRLEVWHYLGGIRYFNDTVGHIFEGHIDWLFMNGTAKGCATRLYCPEAVVTREQMASFLVRALGLPDTTTDFFTDDETSVHESDINSLAASEITTGCTPTQFCPTQRVTREEMASFLARALNLGSGIDFFTDDETSIHEADINGLAASGITTGCGGGRFCPTASVTRGQMAAFLYRGLGPPHPVDHYGAARP